MTWGDSEGRGRGRSRSERVRRAIQLVTTQVKRDQRIHGLRPAWGQFLDLDVGNRQVGIYGTSAAIQVLAGDPVGGASPVEALPVLPGLPMTDVAASLNPEDLALTLKCTAVVDALTATKTSAPLAPAERLLLDSMVATADLSQPVPRSTVGTYAGWGLATDHVSVDFSHVYPDVLSTAHVVLALRGARTAERVAPTERSAVDLKLAHAARWAWDQVKASSDASEVEWALTYLALKTYEGQPDALGMPVSKMLRDLQRVLRKRMRGLRISELRPAEPRFYSIRRLGARTENHYVTFPVRSVVAWALAEGSVGRFPRQRQIFEICDAITDAVDLEKAPVSVATGGKSITDSLYAVRLLRAASLRVEIIDARWWRRWGLHAAAVVGVMGSAVVFFAGAIASGILSVGAGPEELRGVATVFVGVLPIPGVALWKRALALIRRGP